MGAKASRQREQVHAESRRLTQVERVAKAATADKLRVVERRFLEEIALPQPGLPERKPEPAKRNRK